jgi:uncharacterized membrane-anchored protein
MTRYIFPLAIALCIAFCIPVSLSAQDEDSLDVKAQLMFLDSIELSFTYQHGDIRIDSAGVVLHLPDGFKYLDHLQAAHVLVDIWGNMPSTGEATLGLVMPEDTKLLSNEGFVFNLQYDNMGYVKDDDAEDIDYNELLNEIKVSQIEENKERAAGGYDTITIIGWAATPFYDKENKVLHWAKELAFSDRETNTLNYDIRFLGRKGVFIVSAIADIKSLAAVQQDIPQMLKMVSFENGKRYDDFDSNTDTVAAWTIGGLVAGKILAKAGFFVLILKFWKLILIGFTAAGAWFWRIFKRKKKENDNEEIANALPATVPTSEITEGGQN